MDIELLKDLIRDERGNYYAAVHKEGDELTLVHALLERSYREVLAFTDEFRTKFAGYEGQFIGKIAADALRHDIVFASRADGEGRMYELESVAAHYRISFIDTIEFYRHPRA